ncbi:MAG TPA: lamin tail domain-containing protein, partial [Herpetosiphonaceae bacterium]|nr:lamin tail domain-containing protein [Herpetosiphonaceae bacterium]
SVPSATLPAVTPVCAGVANTNASNNPIAITNVNKVGETVSIQNVSADTIDLSGWWICSMLGHQLHAVLSGTIAPGQSIIIPSQAGAPIWNNTSTDPAALYRRNGVQIGYRTQ